MAKKKDTKLYIPGSQNECPVKWNEEYECWEITGSTMKKAFEDPDADSTDKARIVDDILKKSDIGTQVLPVAITALKMVRDEIAFEGYYEQDILKLAEKILKDEYKVNRYSYE